MGLGRDAWGLSKHQGHHPVPSRIYKYQAHGYAFSSLEELLRSLGGDAFINMTQRSVAESLLEVGVTQRFVDDVIAAVLRSSYGQSVLVPAFAGETRTLLLPLGLLPCVPSMGRLLSLPPLPLPRSHVAGGGPGQHLGSGRRQQAGVFRSAEADQSQRHCGQGNRRLSAQLG